MEFLQDRIKIGHILHDRSDGKIVFSGRGIVQSNLRLDRAVFKEGQGGFDVLRGLLDLLADAVGATRCRENGAVRDLMSRRVRAEEPIEVHLAAHGKGEPGVDVAVALGAVAALRGLGTVPTDLRFGDPEGTILHRTDEVVEEGRASQPARGVVVVELDDVELLRCVVERKAVEHHEVGADRRVRILVENFCLLLGVIDRQVRVEFKPGGLQGGMCPFRAFGRDHVFKRIVGQRPAIHDEGFVQIFDGSIAVF